MRMRWWMSLALLAVPILPAHASDPGPTIYAHRGFAAVAPENTLAAFRNAQTLFAGAGVDGWLEMDTQSASDGTLVVIHDDTLDRTTTCHGAVIATTPAAIAACNAAKDWPSFGFEPVPTLRAVLEAGLAASPVWGLMIEIKDIPGEANFDATGALVAERLVALVAETGYPKDRLIVQSFWPPALDRVKLLDPDLEAMLLTTSQLPALPPGAGFTVAENAAYATARGYEISAPDQNAVDMGPESVAAAHALGRRVVVWTVDSVADRDRMLAAGADGIISNRPDVVLPS